MLFSLLHPLLLELLEFSNFSITFAKIFQVSRRDMISPTFFSVGHVPRPQSGIQLHFWRLHGKSDLFTRNFPWNC